MKTVAPNAKAREAFGKNVLDPVNRAVSARVGCAQAKNEAAALRAAWSG